ncbi:MAG: arylesterase [Balneolia bacterium]|nr:arylesterase [Balneolia bacterium]
MKYLSRLFTLPLIALLFAAFTLGSSGEGDLKRVVIFGDSIAAGYGLDSDEAFPALIQQKVNEAGMAFEVVNAGLSGETSAAGLRRIDWILRRPVDVFVLELGGNDGLRGIDPDVTRENLSGIMTKVREANPDVRILLTGMEAPPNMGDSYTTRFREIFPELAREYDVPLMPFILEDVAGIPELNLPDQIHPTAEGHEIIAQNVWEYLKPVLEEAKN